MQAARRLSRVLALHGIDGILLTASFWLVSSGFPGVRPFTAAAVGTVLLCLNALAAYSSGDARRDRWRLLHGSLLALLVLACLAVFPPRLPFSPAFLVLFGLVAFAALSAGRTLADQVVRQFYLRGIGLRRALLIGDLDEVGRAIQQLRDDRNIDQYLVGHVAPDEQPDPTAIGTLSSLPAVLDAMDVQEVILSTVLSPDAVQTVADCCFQRGIRLLVFPAVLGTVNCRAEPLRVRGCPLLHVYPARVQMPTFFIKRVFDIILAVVLLVLAAPIMIAIALAIRLDSPGSVFYRQQRVGLGGRRFVMWKFRSMFANAEVAQARLAHLNAYSDPRLFKLPNDPRITRVGRFLRRSSLDELPQLFNVLMGEMSLVGPRPPLPLEVARYEPHHYVRLAVLPGITGPWQVNGRNLITDFEAVVQLERTYIHSWSLLLDVKILVRTIGVVLSGEGAY